jgi:hypothetical protein
MRKLSYLVLTTFIFNLLMNVQIFGQKTTEELGKIVFNSFKLNSFDTLYKLKPTTDDLMSFMASLGINKKSLNIKDIDEMRENGLIEFKKLCENVRKDAIIGGASWYDAAFDKVVTSEYNGVVATSNAKGKVLTITIIDILFNSNNQSFKIRLPDCVKYDSIWKMGAHMEFMKSK